MQSAKQFRLTNKRSCSLALTNNYRHYLISITHWRSAVVGLVTVVVNEKSRM